MNDFEYINKLLDFYETLLTIKQLEIMTYYYRENYSLNEIAEIQNVTKSAIHDNIKRSIKILNYYEDKLKLIEKFNSRNKLYDELKNDLNSKIIQKLKNID